MEVEIGIWSRVDADRKKGRKEDTKKVWGNEPRRPRKPWISIKIRVVSASLGNSGRKETVFLFSN